MITERIKHPDSAGTPEPSPRRSRPIQILLVEDNLGDIRLTEEALHDAKIRNQLHVVRDGVAALEFLRREGAYTRAQRPDLILLDLNLPKKDGRSVLREIKTDSRLKRIPVVVMSTSAADRDVLQSYDDHANSYITKPVEFDRFLAVLTSMQGFWLEIVKLPGDAEQ